MKKLLLALAASLLFAFGVNAHAATPVGTANVAVAHRLNGSNWIPVLANSGSTYNPLPMPILLYGQSAGNAYPVACDTAGNLITPIPVVFSSDFLIFYLQQLQTMSVLGMSGRGFPEWSFCGSSGWHC